MMVIGHTKHNIDCVLIQGLLAETLVNIYYK